MKYLLFLFLLIASRNSFAQLNLVPNPSFEDTVYCPFGTNQIDACANWLNFGNSPDYFNACNPFGMSVPNSVFGFQYAHSGVGMAGIGLYRRPNSPSGPNYREFIGVELNQPLIIGQKYFFSCYTNFSGQLPVAIACNKFGVNFYTQPFDSCCPPPINNSAKIYTDSILADTINWFRLAGSFIADSAYSYLCIGNFFTDINTDTIRIGSIPDYSYYYVDDVCITTDSIFNETWTSLPYIIDTFSLRFWPNPFRQSFFINKCLQKNELSIYDLTGRIVNFNIACTENDFSYITPLPVDNLSLLFVKIHAYAHSPYTFRILLQP